MKKKFVLLTGLLIITLLYGCGYEPIYSSKNFLFKINEIKHANNKIDNQIAKSLKSISNDNTTNIFKFRIKF